MVVSKRVQNAKSERFYKSSLGKRRQPGVWESLRKQLSAHPLLIAFFFFITVFSGVFSFFMYLPAVKAQFSARFNDV